MGVGVAEHPPAFVGVEAEAVGGVVLGAVVEEEFPLGVGIVAVGLGRTGRSGEDADTSVWHCCVSADA